MIRELSSFAALAALVIGTEAGAQNVDSIASQVDLIKFTAPETVQAPRRQVTGDAAMEFGAEAEKTPEFTFSLGALSAYSSNAFKADTGEVDDVHINPSATLSWEKPLGRVKLNASLQLNYDEYVDLAAADASLILGSVGASLGDPSAKLSPYAAYSPTVAYGDFYDNHVVTFHDVTIGARRLLPLRKDEAKNVLTSLLIDVSFTRREASLATQERWTPTLSLKFNGAISPELSWVLKPQLQGRFYTGDTSDGRDDYNLKIFAGIDWKLLRSGKKTPFKVSFGITFEHNDSDVADKDYTLWDIGPSLTFTRKF